jgi:hypothetical protein
VDLAEFLAYMEQMTGRPLTLWQKELLMMIFVQEFNQEFDKLDET